MVTRIDILAHSQQMLVYAQQARWDDLARLKRTFQPMLEDYFAQHRDIDAQQRDLLRHLLEQNDQISDLVREGQAEIRRQQQQEQSNTRALQSYLDAE